MNARLWTVETGMAENQAGPLWRMTWTLQEDPFQKKSSKETCFWGYMVSWGSLGFAISQDALLRA